MSILARLQPYTLALEIRVGADFPDALPHGNRVGPIVEIRSIQIGHGAPNRQSSPLKIRPLEQGDLARKHAPTLPAPSVAPTTILEIAMGFICRLQLSFE